MRIYFIIFLVFRFFLATAQTIQVPSKNYSISTNFLTNNIYSIFKDSKGLMWFGTDNGVILFDGTKFKLLTTNDGLPDNEIFNFCEDHLGRIWFASFNGKMGYYFKGQLFNEKTNSELIIPKHPSYIYFIGRQYDSTVLFFYYNSNLISEFKNGHFKTIDLKIERRPSELIHSVTKIGENNYCVSTNYSDYQLLGNKISIIEKKQILEFYCYNNGFIYEKKNDSLFLREGCNSNFLYKLRNFSEYLLTIFIDDHKNLFIGTFNGVYFFPSNKEESKINFLTDCKVSSINQDIEGNYWIGTLNKGAFFLPHGFQDIGYYRYPQIAKISAFRKLNNKLYLFTEDNKIYQVSDSITMVQNYNWISSLSGVNNRYFITQDINHLYIGSNLNFTVEINKKDELKVLKKDWAHQYWKNIKVKNGFLYGHNNYSMLRLNLDSIRSSKNNKQNVNNFFQVSPEDHNRIFDFDLDQNELLVSTNQNLYRLVKDSLFKVNLGGLNSFKRFNIINGKLVGITHDYKLVVGERIDNLHYNFQFLDQPCAWIEMTYIFNKKVLMSSDKGYYILDISKDSATLTPSENVILPNYPREIICDSPFVYFLSVDNEITKIHNSLISAAPIAPKLTLISVKTNGNFLDFNQTMNIKYQDSKNIQFEFTGIGFGRKNITYQYSVNHQEWTNLEVPRFSLVNPEAGNYNIRLRCKSDNSNYGEATQFDLVIDKVWYKTIWFLLFSIAFLSSILFLLSRYFFKRKNLQLKLKHEDEMRFQHAEFKALNALMNPHFIFNSLNSIQYLINSNDKIGANEYLSTFSLLIRQNIENINKELIGLDKEMILVQNYLELEKLRFGQKLNFEINIDEELDINKVMIPPLLVQPLVENAIKHGLLNQDNIAGGFIWVNIYEIDNKVIILVRNTTKDEKTNELNTGLNQSISNIKERFEKLENIHKMHFKLEISDPSTTQQAQAFFEAKISIG